MMMPTVVSVATIIRSAVGGNTYHNVINVNRALTAGLGMEWIANTDHDLIEGDLFATQ